MFAAYAASLTAPEIHEIVAHAEPLSDFLSYRFPANQRRRYERLTRFPNGYLVFGDAMCSFNPVYGQGMTVAAQEAALLRRLPERRASTIWRNASSRRRRRRRHALGYRRRQRPAASRGAGPRPAKVRFINWYIGKLHMAAQHDEKLANAFLRVANLVAPPPTLLSPAKVWRVICGNLSRRGRESCGERAGRTSGPSAVAEA